MFTERFNRKIHRDVKTVTIGLLRKRLFYDVSLAAHISAASMEDGHLLEDTESTDRINRITYALDTAWNDILYKVTAYTRFLNDEDTTVEEEDSLPDEEKYYVQLAMPVAFPKGLIPVVEKDMHDYMVNYAIADWYSFLNKEEAARFATLAAANLDNIKLHLDSRVSAYHTRLEPF